MRQCHHDTEVITDGNGKFIGIALGADFCAEHEWGIDSLKRAFGIGSPTKDKAGLEARKITQNGNQVELLRLKNPDKKKKAKADQDVALVFDPYNIGEEVPERRTRWAEKALACWWDSKSFMIRASAAWLPQLTELHEAFARGDVSIWLGGRWAFGGGGLIILITSRASAEQSQKMINADLAAITLREQAEATGIEAKLKAAGKKWFALKPGGVLKDRGQWGGLVTTKHPVMFFLNPENQKDNRSGWFTVEELEQWAKNKGPVVIQKK